LSTTFFFFLISFLFELIDVALPNRSFYFLFFWHGKLVKGDKNGVYNISFWVLNNSLKYVCVEIMVGGFFFFFFW
jgi:hypothetical protein